MKFPLTRRHEPWRAGPLFPALPHTTSLRICDLRAASSEVRLSIATLAGLVNRGPARIYVVESDDDEFWLNEIDPALPRTHAPAVGNELLDYLLELYRDSVGGLVLYDPTLPDTINVATTLAALRSGLVVSPAQAGALQKEPHRLPILADLRAHGWRAGLQAYAWACGHLLPECSRELVAGLGPGIQSRLRSFLVAHRVFTCWLDARKAYCAPWRHQLSERSLFKRILAHFPPGAVHLGWFVSEPFGIRLTSRAALLTLASDHCGNLEIWSTLPARSRMAAGDDQAPARVPDRHPRPSLNEGGWGRKNTTYVSFTISDGDNLQYCQHHLLRLWNDPARGSVPLGWTISPALQQVMPDLASFYRRTASAKDEFIAGPSGATYLLPSCLPRAQRAAFLRLTAEYMQAMRLDSLQVLDNSGWFAMKFLNPGLQKQFSHQLAVCGLRGIFSGAGSPAPSWHRRVGIPIYQNLGLALNPQRTLRLIRLAAKHGVRFINIYIFAWNITPSDLRNIVEQLGEDFTVVTPGELLSLLQDA